jgi:hypothetical protein
LELDYALRIRHADIKPGWEQWYLLTSDAHWDAPECYLKLLHKHLMEAKERDALGLARRRRRGQSHHTP